MVKTVDQLAFKLDRKTTSRTPDASPTSTLRARPAAASAGGHGRDAASYRDYSQNAREQNLEPQSTRRDLGGSGTPSTTSRSITGR